MKPGTIAFLDIPALWSKSFAKCCSLDEEWKNKGKNVFNCLINYGASTSEVMECAVLFSKSQKNTLYRSIIWSQDKKDSLHRKIKKP